MATSNLSVQIAASTQAEIDDWDPSIVYTTNEDPGDNSGGPTWTAAAANPNDPGDFDTTEHWSNFATTAPVFQIHGAAAVFNFTGTTVSWIGKIAPNLGIALVSIDGGTPVSVDNYAAGEQQDQHADYTISGLSNGSHALKIELTSNENAAATADFQVIDAFKIDGQPLEPSSGVIAGYNSSAVTYGGGGWNCGADATDHSGGHCWNPAANTTVSWTFTGSLVEVYGRPDLEDGIFNVLIDGAQVGTVDGHYSLVDNDALNGYPLFIGKVAPGTHTIELVNTGTHDSAATNAMLQFDEFMAFP